MRDIDLDDLFAAVRDSAPRPSAALMARVEADAAAAQAARRPAPAHPAKARRRTGWIQALGGRGVLAGLASAALAGLWLGVAKPAPVQALTEAYAPETALGSVELIPSLDAFGTEG
jgi:hypothetical protein